MPVNDVKSDDRPTISRSVTERMEKKVQVGKDQEKAQSEKDSHSKTKVGKNQTNNQVLIP